MSARQARLTTTTIAVGGVALLIAVVVNILAPRFVTVTGSLLWIGLAVLPLYLVAVWINRRRPDHPQSKRLLLVATALSVGVAIEVIIRLAFAESSSTGWMWWANLLYQLTAILTEIGAAQLFATYPDGIVEKAWQRTVVRLTWWWLALPPLLLLVSPTVPVDQWLINPTPSVPNPLAVPWLAQLAPVVNTIYISYLGGMLAMVVLLARYRAADGEQRRRMQLLVWVVAFGVVVLGASFLLKLAGAPDAVIRVIESLFIIIMLMVPVSIVVGVMRYRLYEIDVIVRKSVVFGALSAGIAIIYVALAVAPGLALGDQIPWQLAVVITILAALAFQPVRRRLESVADRWVFGTRVNKYQLLTDFGSSLEQTVGLADLLPRLADTVRQGLGAPWVRVSLPGAGSVAGEPSGEPELTVPLERTDPRCLGRTVLGRIECGPKTGGYEPGDQELLTTLAGQAATAIANVQLTAELAERLDELEQSRARIVAAQDAERRRIERNIHDGVQQQVVALMMKLRLARNQVGRGERTPENAFVELQGDVKELLADLRELAHGIHPPVLSDGGLVAAVQARTARLPFDVHLTASPGLHSRRFAEDVEGAAYFVVCEALTNVGKHAGAAAATEVALSAVDGHLSVQIHDDGKGFEAVKSSGAGLTNLRDRVEALGGRFDIWTRPGLGTSVIADLPLASVGSRE